MVKNELFEDLFSVGKKQGYLTYDEINNLTVPADAGRST